MRLSIALFAASVLLVCMVATSSWGSLLATADVTTPDTSAPFHYTITLHNTGDTNIGTFWFAWTSTPADYNFLPTSPTVTGGPSGWISPVTHNPFPGDGYGIEWYNYVGSAIAPGGTGLFQFTSNDSPATLAGNAYIPPFKVSHSFVYIGFPETDPGFQFNVSVPEPIGCGLVALVGCATLARRRQWRSVSR